MARHGVGRIVGKAAALLAAAGIAAMAPVALAADLQVSPISLEFPAREQAQALWLSNTGTAPLRAQVRVLEWSQAEGQDQLAPTRDLVASPPMLEIAPGQNQLVRIIRLQPTPTAREQSYRLLVDELPGAGGQESSGLQFLLQYSIPVYVLPEIAAVTGAGQPAPLTDLSQLSTRITGSGGDAMLEIGNRAASRVRISQLAYVARTGERTDLVPGLLGYVLAGQTMRWPVTLPPSAGPGGTLTARFNHDPEPQRLASLPAAR